MMHSGSDRFIFSYDERNTFESIPVNSQYARGKNLCTESLIPVG